MSTQKKLIWAPVLLVCALRAQSPSAGIESRAQLVTLNVVAVDGHGQPVSDLTSDDFQIQDQGKRQQIVYFRNISEHDTRRHDAHRGTTVILLDLLNANMSDRGSGWEGISRALEHLESGEDLYLYLLTADARLFPVHGLPGAEESGAGHNAAGSDWTKQIRKQLDDAIRTVNRLRPQDERDPSIRIRQTYKALGDLASQMAAIPGRKNMVWITHGVPVNFVSITNERIDLTGQLRNLGTYLNRAGVAMYSVDQGGPGSLPTGREGPGYQSQDTLQQLAELTGGRAFPGNNVETAVPAAIASARGSYLILYDPPAQNWDGKFHKVSVKCSRKGIHIQAQQGYLANAETGMEPLRAAFEAAARNQTDVSGIGLSAKVSASAGSALHFELRIDAADVVLLHQEDGYSGQLAVGVMSLMGGQLESTAPVLMNVKLTKEQYAAAMKDGIPFVQDKAVGEGVQKVRIVVLDLNSAEVGAVTLAVHRKTD